MESYDAAEYDKYGGYDDLLERDMTTMAAPLEATRPSIPMPRRRETGVVTPRGHLKQPNTPWGL